MPAWKKAGTCRQCRSKTGKSCRNEEILSQLSRGWLVIQAKKDWY